MRKILIYTILTIIWGGMLLSCDSSDPKSIHVMNQHTSVPAQVDSLMIDARLGELLAKEELKGAILIYDATTQQYFTNDAQRVRQGYLPASTFKITNSIIGWETGVLDTATLFKWDGRARRLKSWEKDFDLEGAFKASCVPCYQEVARKIGAQRMRAWLDSLHYGQMAVDSSTIDKFWLEGDSRISCMQQLDFLKRLKEQKLPLKPSTYEMIQQIMLLYQSDNFKLYGKTGWSIRDGFNVGWFVGYAEKGDKVFYVITNVEPEEEFDMDQFAKIRLKISLQALELAGYMGENAQIK